MQKKGTVKTVTYTTRKYNENNEVISKNMDIYLPYGYSTSDKYDVLIMIHGAGEHYNEWTNNPITVGSVMSNPRNIYDNMIDQRLCRPLIIASVSPMYYGENGETDSGYKQMTQEIRNDILPYIAEHFSTYAGGITAKSISKVRDHFGLGGEGKGAVYAYCCGMSENFDLFGNFVCISGCGDYKRYADAVNLDDNRELDIRCYFAGSGKYNPQRYSSYSGYSFISEETEKIEESVNSYYTEIETSDSEWTERTSLMYNALLVLFPQKTGEND